MIEKINALAKQLNIPKLGIVKAEVYSDLGTFLSNKKNIPMVPDDYNLRTNPFLLMPNAQSIIVFLFPYSSNNEKGNLSKYAYGLDYHVVIKNKLLQISKLLSDNNFSAIVYTDNGPLNDRYLAYKAGLGFYGKNGFLINPDYGTFTFIGYIITDCPLPNDLPINTTCMECMKCINSCPGKALGENFNFSVDRCISYITQKKGELSEFEKSLLKESGYAWGCDICQNVCPHNIKAMKTQIPEFCDNLIIDLDIDGSLSNKEFKKIYSNRAFTWRGKSTILRNLNILNENSNKN